jgi:hypothetical protein
MVFQLKCLCCLVLIVVPILMKNECNALIPNIGAGTVPTENCLLNFTVMCGATPWVIGWCVSCTDPMQYHP